MEYYNDSIPGFFRPKTPAPSEEVITEFQWQNGPVLVPFSAEGLINAEREIRSSELQLMNQEESDELTSWLQYPPDDIFPIFPPQSLTFAEIRPPPPPIQSPATIPENPPRDQNWQRTGGETTVVDSNGTPMVAPFSHMPLMYTESGTATAAAAAAGTSAAPAVAAGTCGLNLTTPSPGGSRTSFSAIEETHHPQQKPAAAAAGRKRKTRELGDNECEETKKRARRSRAAEVHNQSERRRRRRINEKVRTLQQLTPRCIKTGTASTLVEVGEYIKSLQQQIKMYQSMGCGPCGVVPMMHPSMQQYVPAMGMNWRMAPYPSMLSGSEAHMAGPRFPMAPLHMQPIPASNPCRIQTPNQADPPPNSVVYHHQNQAHMPNFVDPNQQFIGLQQPLAQNQAMAQLWLYQAYQQRNWQP